MPTITTYGVGKTDDIVYNDGGQKLDLYRITNPSNINEIILYVHGGYFMRGTEENEYAQKCATKFNEVAYNVISMAYTLQSEESYAQAMAVGGQSATTWWLNAVISATNDLIDAIEFIKTLGINKINIIGYSAGSTMALLSTIGPSPFNQYGLKLPDRSVMHSVTAIAGSLTTPTVPPTTAHEYLDNDSPTMMLWIGTDDQVVAASGAQAIKNKYAELGRSNDCMLNLLEGVGHDNIWDIHSSGLPNSNYDDLLPLGAASLFIRENHSSELPDSVYDDLLPLGAAPALASADVTYDEATDVINALKSNVVKIKTQITNLDVDLMLQQKAIELIQRIMENTIHEPDIPIVNIEGPAQDNAVTPQQPMTKSKGRIIIPDLL